MENTGKIHRSEFVDIIQPMRGFARGEVTTGAEFGVDTAIIDLQNGNVLAVTSDPLSLIPTLGLQESAWLSVHLMANDMATTGFAPQYAQMVLNLPPTLSKADFKQYWSYIHRYCSEMGVAITGGHTGSIEGQESTIAGGGTMMTIAPKSDILVSGQAKSGDVILVTKACALSTVAILGMSFPETIKQKLGKSESEEAASLFYNTSSLKEGITITALGFNNSYISAMHDVTEGGVLGAVYEMAIASGNGVLIDDLKLPIGQIQQDVCALFDLDPRYCIGAGSMIISVDREHAPSVIGALAREDIPCTEIGTFKNANYGMKIFTGQNEEPLPYYENDPYWAAFSGALKKGWK
ncbi:MAG: AIR synthase [Bacteroidetes bacterium]|jgi:hydrogenase maturation factor|nr:AIR synthase [Bacteroidota bacterium]